MNRYARSPIAGVILIVTLAIASWQILGAVSGKMNAREVIKPIPAASLDTQSWLAYGAENPCDKDPCLVVQHVEADNGAHSVIAYLTTYPATEDDSQVLLTTRVTFMRDGDGVQLTAKHIPTPDLQEPLLRAGVDLEEFRAENLLYGVTGSWSWTSATVDLPYGAISQYLFNGFQKVSRAKGLDPDLDRLLGYADIVTAEVNRRFNISTLSGDARVAMIVAGPTQTLTYGVALLAILFVIAECRSPQLRPYSDGLADLIPFTGFFGTLLGVSAGLEVLGLSNVTDDVSKALSLGKIGSSLGFAINTTILAIVVFGFVLVFQYAVRSILGTSITDPSAARSAPSSPDS